MPDRLKERLDADWHEFLDALNTTYEDAYRDLMQLAPKIGGLQRVVISEVHWPVDDAIHIQLGAVVRTHGGQHEPS